MKSIILFLFSFLCLCHFLLQQGHRKVLWLNSSFSGFLGFPDSSVGKESACNAEDPGSIPGLRRSAGEGKFYTLQYSWTSLVAQLVKNPPAMQETRVPSLGWEDPLEKGKAAHSSILAWEFHGLYGVTGSDTTERLPLLLWVLVYVRKVAKN